MSRSGVHYSGGKGDAMALAAGSIIGPYEIERQIGSGGMATVYRAFQPKLDRHVAIKVLHQNFAQDPQFTARFEREARIVARLDHPNIVPIYDYDRIDGQPYLVMKAIDGVTLKSLLQKSPLTADDALQILLPVADALTYAHEQGVLHRDIKPSNILLDAQGRPYLTDFGLARVAQQGESSLSVDTMLGTPHYLSPEQAKGEPLDGRTDVYALGVVLYEIVIGQVPFSGESSMQIVHDQIYTPPPRPRELVPDLPESIEAVLMRALAKNPEDRYPTPNALITAFRSAVVGDNRASSMPVRDVSNVQPSAVSVRDEQAAEPPRGHVSIPSPRTASASNRDEFSEVQENLRAAGQEIKAAFQQFANTWEKPRPHRMIPRPRSTWRSDGPDGPGFYNADEIEAFDDSIPLETRIRRRVERKLKARQELITMAVTFVSLTIMFWAIWSFSTPGGFPWPIFPMVGFTIGFGTKFAEYHQKYGRGYENQQRMIQQELARERALQGEFYGPKRKNEEELRGVRLTGDGELTESFIQEIEDDYDQRRR